MENVDPVLDIGPLPAAEVPPREAMYSLLLRKGKEEVAGFSMCGERGGVAGLARAGIDSDGNMIAVEER